LPFHVSAAVSLLVGYGLVFASLIMTGLTLGQNAVIALLRCFLIWRVGWKWYLVAFLLFPVILVSAVGFNAVLTQTAVDFSTVLAHYSAPVSSPILGVIWGLWHVPKFMAPGNNSPLGWFMVKVMATVIE